MEFICTLDEKVRNCPFANQDKIHCDCKNTGCGYRKLIKKEEMYKREPRWYEKYYK